MMPCSKLSQLTCSIQVGNLLEPCPPPLFNRGLSTGFVPTCRQTVSEAAGPSGQDCIASTEIEGLKQQNAALRAALQQACLADMAPEVADEIQACRHKTSLRHAYASTLLYLRMGMYIVPCCRVTLSAEDGALGRDGKLIGVPD